MGERRRDRDEAVAARAAAEDRRRATERARAQALVDDFVRAMRERGEPPVPLRARAAGRRATYRTDRVGWYVRRNKALAVGQDGSFLILDVPASLGARVRGVTITPSDPPLVVGRGARDGEAIDLADLLAQRLDDPVR